MERVFLAGPPQPTIFTNLLVGREEVLPSGNGNGEDRVSHSKITVEGTPSGDGSGDGGGEGFSSILTGSSVMFMFMLAKSIWTI